VSAKTLAAEIRVTSLDDATGVPGLHWEVVFRVDGEQYHLVAERLPDGDQFEVRDVVVVNPAGANVVNATETRVVAVAVGAIDVARSTVRMTVPLAALGLRAAKCHSVEFVRAASGLVAGSAQVAVAPQSLYVEDEAVPSPTLVKPSRPFSTCAGRR
jgi:hypothetical protein